MSLTEQLTETPNDTIQTIVSDEFTQEVEYLLEQAHAHQVHVLSSQVLERATALKKQSKRLFQYGDALHQQEVAEIRVGIVREFISIVEEKGEITRTTAEELLVQRGLTLGEARDQAYWILMGMHNEGILQYAGSHWEIGTREAI